MIPTIATLLQGITDCPWGNLPSGSVYCMSHKGVTLTAVYGVTQHVHYCITTSKEKLAFPQSSTYYSFVFVYLPMFPNSCSEIWSSSFLCRVINPNTPETYYSTQPTQRNLMVLCRTQAVNGTLPPVVSHVGNILSYSCLNRALAKEISGRLPASKMGLFPG